MSHASSTNGYQPGSSLLASQSAPFASDPRQNGASGSAGGRGQQPGPPARSNVPTASYSDALPAMNDGDDSDSDRDGDFENDEDDSADDGDGDGDGDEGEDSRAASRSRGASESVEPAELGEERDAINSGAVTPFIGGENTAASSVTGRTTAALTGLAKAPSRKRNKESTIVIKGATYKIINDEIDLELDPRGEAKIDEDGQLLGGREWKVKTFCLPSRGSPTRLYMLSIEAARCAGFRDSLYFFRKNETILKINMTSTEKEQLITSGMISGSLRSRSVTVVSARNVYKIMGAKFVKNGKFVFDDYYETRALQDGVHAAGDSAHVEPYLPAKDAVAIARKAPGVPKFRPLTSNTLGGHGQGDYGSSSAFGSASNGLAPFAVSADPSFKKVKLASHLTEDNWMHQYALAVSETNAELRRIRQAGLRPVRLDLSREEGEAELYLLGDEYKDGEEEQEKAEARRQRRKTEARVARIAEDLGEEEDDDDDDEDDDEDAAGEDEDAPNTSTGVSTPALASASGSRATSQKPHQRKRRKIFNPIRGAHDPETNSPLVPADTQPTRAIMVRMALTPQLELDPHLGPSSIPVGPLRPIPGLASFEIVAVDDEQMRGPVVVPGGWEFRVPV